jgi:hypothetical protein
MSKRYGEGQLPPFRHVDHPRPVTRRQFLAQGFITGAAWITAPTILGLFKTSEARAQAAAACGLGGSANKLPFLVFDLGGGASIAGSNVLVGTQTQLDPLSPAGYTKMGLPAGRTPTDPLFVDQSLGLAFHSESALLRGIRMRAQQRRDLLRALRQRHRQQPAQPGLRHPRRGCGGRAARAGRHR